MVFMGSKQVLLWLWPCLAASPKTPNVEVTENQGQNSSGLSSYAQREDRCWMLLLMIWCICAAYVIHLWCIVISMCDVFVRFVIGEEFWWFLVNCAQVHDHVWCFGAIFPDVWWFMKKLASKRARVAFALFCELKPSTHIISNASYYI
jgi:hypothetical protein